MKTLRVELETRSYSIYIGAGLMARPELITTLLAGNQAMVVTNETVAPLYLDRVLGALADVETRSVQLPDGEEFKTLQTLEIIFDALLRARFGRDCTVVALGGGVVGDIAGFAAACYQRGVAHVQLPTTLLAQVDSSVGGKTAVNHPLGKNMIGAFHQPNGVIADTDTLATLAERELRAGMAEVIKYGAIRDADFFEWLEAHLESLLERDPKALEHAIYRSCYNKAEVVADDERESGVRALLNFGHTFGHAIETGLGYGRWLHGEAVAAGMCLAAHLSARMGWIDEAAARRVEALVARAGLPTRRPQELTPARMQELMAVDKKTRAGRSRLVLLRGIGDARLTDEFDPQLVQATLAEN